MNGFICHIELRNGQQFNYKDSYYDMYIGSVIVREPLEEGIIVRHIFDIEDVTRVILLYDK